MGWRLRVRHETGFTYAGPVRSSYNEARLTPLTGPGQTVLETRVQIPPTATSSTYRDYWGTHVTAFDLHAPPAMLSVVATSVVETGHAVPAAEGGCEWVTLTDLDLRDRWVEMLGPTDRTRVDDRLHSLARTLADTLEPDGAARSVCDWVRDTVDYVPGSTSVLTSAQEAYDGGSGVCQDLAHLSLGMLRSLGLPARYVSGYLHPQADAEIGAMVVGQSHAWVEWWAGAWVGFDPTNGIPAGAQHVVVARGRDYADVPPLKGLYHGGASTALGVEVEVTRLA